MLTVLPPFHTTQMIEDTPAQYKARVQKHAQKVWAPSPKQEQAAGIACETVQAQMSIPIRRSSIPRSRNNCDLIVMASHGRHGISAIVPRQRNGQVLTHCKFPALVHHDAPCPRTGQSIHLSTLAAVNRREIDFANRSPSHIGPVSGMPKRKLEMASGDCRRKTTSSEAKFQNLPARD